MRRGLPAAALLVLALAGCGGGDGGGKPELTVSAAASLQNAFERYGSQLSSARARFSFAGSDELAAQIRRGVRPDLYAAANTKLPDQLFRAGLVARPTVFAGNRLVIAVTSGSGRVTSLHDLARPGVQLAVGAPSVPVGAYTRQVLDGLPTGERRRILANVRSEEPDVAGVVGKLAQGAADAGFVYVTDVVAAKGRLKAIELPPRLRPAVAYGIAVVRGSKHAAEARAFVRGLLSGRGRAVMRQAGFEPPPR